MTDIPVKCLCGSENLDNDSDCLTVATIIECLDCGRMVGGLDRDDAVKMWNLAMSVTRS